MTPDQRRLRARIGAFAMHARNGAEPPGSAAARIARFEREVDPDDTLPSAERARRAEAAMRAHMTRLAFNRSRAAARELP
jgi:hypothetical protein